MQSTKNLLKTSGEGRIRLAAALAVAAMSAAVPMAHAADPGMTVTKDPQTGQLRAPTAEEMEALKAKEASTSSARQSLRAAPLTERYHANGAVSVMLDESFMSYSVVTRNADGSLREDCVVGADAANAIVSGKTKKTAKAPVLSSKEHAHEVR